MRLSVTHETRYDYQPAVETAHHSAHLQPRQTPGQHLLSFDLQVLPAPAHLRHGHDAFGNPQAWWSFTQAHEGLQVLARSQVETTPPATLHSSQSWEAVREHFRYRSGQPGAARAQVQ